MFLYQDIPASYYPVCVYTLSSVRISLNLGIFFVFFFLASAPRYQIRSFLVLKWWSKSINVFWLVGLGLCQNPDGKYGFLFYSVSPTQSSFFIFLMFSLILCGQLSHCSELFSRAVRPFCLGASDPSECPSSVATGLSSAQPGAAAPPPPPARRTAPQLL